MRARLIKLMAALAVIGAFAVGGATLASAGGYASPVQPPAEVQQGDQNAPDAAASAERSSESGASEQAGESGSESAVNDGPGGYADANANADTQFQDEQ